MTWTDKEKELAAVGISVAAGCRPCTDYHLKAVRKTGASEAEIRGAIDTAAAIRREAAAAMKRYALRRRGNEPRTSDSGGAGGPDRVTALLSVGAAFAVNCTESLEAKLVTARSSGVTESELRDVFELAAFIKSMGDRHVRKLAQLEETEAEGASEARARSGSPCSPASETGSTAAWGAMAERMRGRCC